MFHFQNTGYWARNWVLFGREVQPITGALLVFNHGAGGHVGIYQDNLIHSILTLAGAMLVAMGYA